MLCGIKSKKELDQLTTFLDVLGEDSISLTSSFHYKFLAKYYAEFAVLRKSKTLGILTLNYDTMRDKDIKDYLQAKPLSDAAKILAAPQRKYSDLWASPQAKSQANLLEAADNNLEILRDMKAYLLSKHIAKNSNCRASKLR